MASSSYQLSVVNSSFLHGCSTTRFRAATFSVPSVQDNTQVVNFHLSETAFSNKPDVVGNPCRKLIFHDIPESKRLSRKHCHEAFSVGRKSNEEKEPSDFSSFRRKILIGSTAFLLNPLMNLGEEAGQALAARKRPEMDEYDEKKLLEQNRRIQKLNQVPDNFPGFIREGFDVKVVTGDDWVTTPSGLIYLDILSGHGNPPEDGQQVVFNYIGYNESGRRVDSTYQKGAPARTRVGINGLIPGFEEGIKSMRVGGQRRIVIPPDLGPPTGPSTFFSAKQFEVFDIELLDASDCQRRQIGFYSDVVCE